MSDAATDRGRLQSTIRKRARRFLLGLHRFYAVRNNVSLGRDVHIGVGTIIEATKGLTIGGNTYIGKYCTIECDGTIGCGVLIANNVGLIGRHDHDFSSVGVPVRNAPWIGSPEYSGLGKNLELVIGDDVWIGYGAIVLTGVKIFRGAIVAAGSVVTRDVASYDIVAGVPARVVGRRFSDDEIEKHETLVDAQNTRHA